MGVSHTLWPPSIARAILACLWFAQGLHKAQKNKTAEPFYNVQGDSMCSILPIDATSFFSTSLKGIIRKHANHLQTTDTLKRHQRYSIRYHCG